MNRTTRLGAAASILWYATGCGPTETPAEPDLEVCGDGVDSDGDGCDGRCRGSALITDFTRLQLPEGWLLPDDIAAGDLDADGIPDVFYSATYPAADGEVGILPSPAYTGVIRDPVVIRGADIGQAAVAPGDLTGDGVPDLLVSDGSGARVLAGPFAPGEHTAASLSVVEWRGHSGPLAELDDIIEVGDIDGDGDDDVALVYPLEGVVYIIDPAEPGGRVDDRAVASFSGYTNLATGDFNGDGWQDIILGAHVYLGPRTGSWSAADSDAGWDIHDSVAFAGDVDGDGRPDLLLGDTTGDHRMLVVPADLLGVRSAEAEATATLVGGSAWFVDTLGERTLTPGDVDGDGRADLLIEGFHAAILVPTPIPPGPSTVEDLGIALLSSASITAPHPFSLGDVDLDGFADLAFTTNQGPFVVHGVRLACPDHRVWTVDLDADGVGDSADPTALISPLPVDGRSDLSGDCDDTDPTISPLEPERCDDPVDADCDGDPTCDVGDRADASWTGNAYDLASYGMALADRGEAAPTLLVGTPGASIGAGLSGALFAIDPSTTGEALVRDSARLITPAWPYGLLAQEVAAGDLDGDGRDDPVVLADTQAVVVGAWPYPTAVITYPDRIDALAVTGDLDDDGRAELALGSNSLGVNGEVHLFRAPAGALHDADADVVLEATSDIGYLGEQVARGGDTDGDGLAELIMTTDYYWRDYWDYKGMLYVLPADVPNGTHLIDDVSTTILAVDSPYGWSYDFRAVNAGDVNGDGFDDVWSHDYTGTWAAGAITYGPLTDGTLYEMSTTVWLPPIEPQTTPVGDADGDGFDDLLVLDEGGWVLLRGPIEGTLDLEDVDGLRVRASPDAQRGARLPDLDADGFPEVLLRDPYAGPTGLGEGVIWRVGLETWLD